MSTYNKLGRNNVLTSVSNERTEGKVKLRYDEDKYMVSPIPGRHLTAGNPTGIPAGIGYLTVTE
jgi:hypothetical protein